MAKKRIAIIFGGKSAEHEVSIRSARNVLAALNKDKYEPVLIGIDKEGAWRSGSGSTALLETSDPRLLALNANSDREVTLARSGGAVSLVDAKGGGDLGSVDVVFPVLHGTNGEDGTVQGLLKLAGLPFVGPGVLGSAACMDKDVTKRLLRDHGVPVVPWITLRSGEPLSADRVAKELGFPCFVKPANAGSSVGVSKVDSPEALPDALNEAFRFDRKILIERGIKGRELECAVLGNRDPKASVPGEVIPTDSFYSYKAKYVDEKGALLEIPARLSDRDKKRIMEAAVKAFIAAECEGMARIDFFISESDELFVNEINTIPGFTDISMYPKLWEVSGLPYADLVDRLIDLAVERHEEESRLKTSYDF
jgi:D-alanine-D-alanine ligase